MNSEEILTALVSIAAPVFGGGGFWVWWSGRKKAALTDVDARIVVADRLQQMAVVSAEKANARAEDLEADVDELKRGLKEERRARERQSTEHQEQIAILEQRISVLDRAVRVLSTAWDDLRARWHEIRLNEDPPDKPNIHL